MKRLTNVQKEMYGIAMHYGGVWGGTCPDCNESFTATDYSVTQLGVMLSIQRHQTEVHGAVFVL